MFTLPSRNKTSVIVVKNYAKADIKVVFSDKVWYEGLLFKWKRRLVIHTLIKST